MFCLFLNSFFNHITNYFFYFSLCFFLTFFVWLVVFIMFPYLSITLLHYVLVGIVTMWPKRLDLFYLVSSYIKCTYKASWTCSITWSLYCRLMNGAMGKRSVLIRAPPAGWFADPDRVADPGSFGAPGLRIRTGLAKPGLCFLIQPTVFF